MESHQILFEKTAHYYTLGTAGKHVQRFIIACHGYGQLAERFIYKFDQLDLSNTFVLAPEGLSRFYWDNKNNIVGSSWMTKKDRLEEIADYTRFIKKLYDEYVPQFSDDVKITLLGFSQGCATQVRWIMREFPKFDNLILWAGLIPEDLVYVPHEAYFSNKNLYWVYGTQDEFLKEKHVKWHHNFLEEQGLSFQTISFDGKHVVDRSVLNELINQLTVVKS